MPSFKYETPVKVARPYGSYRYDVFSLKAGRRMTLFGKAALSQFIELEADHEVTALCERPIKIPDSKLNRVVDFWALRGGRQHFYLLLSGDASHRKNKPKPAIENFREWVEGESGVLHEVFADAFVKCRTLHDNWTAILQHVVAHRGLVTSAHLERLAIELNPTFTLQQAEAQFHDMDAMLVRAAVFTLLTSGRLSCASLAKEALAPTTLLVRS